jgi:hypothetical protein
MKINNTSLAALQYIKTLLRASKHSILDTIHPKLIPELSIRLEEDKDIWLQGLVKEDPFCSEDKVVEPIKEEPYCVEDIVFYFNQELLHRKEEVQFLKSRQAKRQLINNKTLPF